MKYGSLDWFSFTFDRMMAGMIASLFFNTNYTEVNGLNPGVSVVRSSSVIVRVSVVLKRTVVGD